MTAIVVRSKRQGQREWGYHNRFLGENAEVNGVSILERDRAYQKLWDQARKVAAGWAKIELTTVFEVVDEDLEKKEKRNDRSKRR